MVCRNCYNLINQNDKFCQVCGTKTQQLFNQTVPAVNRCKNCANTLNINDKFCQVCGTKFDIANNNQSKANESLDAFDNNTQHFESVSKCSSCSCVLNKDDLFCPSCGLKVESTRNLSDNFDSDKSSTDAINDAFNVFSGTKESIEGEMRCKKCYRLLNYEDDFCPACGMAAKEEKANPIINEFVRNQQNVIQYQQQHYNQAQQQNSNLYQQQTTNQNFRVDQYTDTFEPEPEGKSKGIIFGIIIIVILLIIASAIAVFFTYNYFFVENEEVIEVVVEDDERTARSSSSNADIVWSTLSDEDLNDYLEKICDSPDSYYGKIIEMSASHTNFYRNTSTGDAKVYYIIDATDTQCEILLTFALLEGELPEDVSDLASPVYVVGEMSSCEMNDEGKMEIYFVSSYILE